MDQADEREGVPIDGGAAASVSDNPPMPHPMNGT